MQIQIAYQITSFKYLYGCDLNKTRLRLRHDGYDAGRIFYVKRIDQIKNIIPNIWEVIE